MSEDIYRAAYYEVGPTDLGQFIREESEQLEQIVSKLRCKTSRLQKLRMLTFLLGSTHLSDREQQDRDGLPAEIEELEAQKKIYRERLNALRESEEEKKQQFR